MPETLRQVDFYTWHKGFTKVGSSTSKGAQPKWYLREQNSFLKQDMHGYESISEWAVYNILDKCSNIPKERLVPYYLCYINDVEGCYSEDFKVEEDEIPLSALGKRAGNRFADRLMRLNSKDGLDFIKSLLESVTGKTFDYELKLMLAVDAFFLNEDRHLTNISLLQDSTGNYRLAPLFDNGMSLLSRLDEYPLDVSIAKHIERVTPYLLDNDFKEHVALYDYKPFLYKNKIKDFVEEHSEFLDRAGRVILYQLNQPHLQKLFISENHPLMKSSIFGG